MLGVVIVSWNVSKLLRKCLQSLLADVKGIGGANGAHVVVVDSASPDDSVAMVRSEFPQVELIACEENVGYVRGNNMALERLEIKDWMLTDGTLTAHGLSHNANLNAPISDLRYIWLLNPDTEVRRGTTEKLVTFMEQHPRCGLCGPKLLNPDGSLQHSAFTFPGLVQLALETQPRLWRWRGTRLDGRYPPALYERGDPFRIGHPLGAAMFARASAIAQVGPLDEGYEMYTEEVDWAMRMRRAGWERWCVPDAVVVHYGGASSGQASERTERVKWRSRQRYYAKHYPPWKRMVAMRLVPQAYREPETNLKGLRDL